MNNPYKEKADHCFWSRAVASPAPSAIDPLVGHFQLARDARIATMGSCFAQHLSRHVEKKGLNYFVPESAPAGMDPQEAARRNYGVFSARYGNVYTVRQALQLFERAYGEFHPREEFWQKADRYYDPFRPQIEPNGFATLDALLASREVHFAAVCRVFSESSHLVLTLGLTEAFRSRGDGAVYPVAPGVAAGSYDPSAHEFVNFDVIEVVADLELLIRKARAVNSGLVFILTVSPVPLIATYEDRHVLVSTTYSKSVLRAAAGMVEQRFDDVIYFPSYEIITAPFNDGQYYEDDLRQVRDQGVAHVMRVFEKHFINTPDAQAEETLERVILSGMKGESEIVCDEELIESSVLGIDRGV
jgi:hypothetical protein